MLDLLLVDAEPVALKDQLSRRFRVRAVQTPAAAMRAVRRQAPHVVVVAQQLGRSSGFPFCAAARAKHPSLTLVVYGPSSRSIGDPDWVRSIDGFHPTEIRPSAVEAATWKAIVDHHVDQYERIRPGQESRWASLALSEPRLEHARDLLLRHPAARRDPAQFATLLRTTSSGASPMAQRLSRLAVYEPDIQARMALTARLAHRVQLEFIQGLDELAALSEPVGPKPALVIVRVGADSPVEAQLLTDLTRRRGCEVLVHGGVVPDAQVARQVPEALFPELLEVVIWEMLEAHSRQSSARVERAPAVFKSAERQVPFAQRTWGELLRSEVCVESLLALLKKDIPLPWGPEHWKTQ